jgi:hypothetical protein
MGTVVIKQRKWTEAELVAHGFRYYPRKKQIVMARKLLAPEAPKTIETAWDTLVAEAGFMICYEPGDMVWPGLEDYAHWPVAPDIFEKTYHAWDETNWVPTPPEAHLMSLGCKPYYKFTGVWAKKLAQDTFVQSLESIEPVSVPAGVWLGIGVEGEPYPIAERTFASRYDLLEQSESTVIRRVIDFFRRRRKA